MRAYARELAFQLIFERLFVKENYSDEEFFASLKKEDDKNFVKEILSCYEQNKESVQELISSNLVGYELNRVYKVDLALLCEAVTEIIYIKTPYKIVVNEIVELAKKFSTEKSSRFINGVLSSIIKSLNADKKEE